MGGRRAMGDGHGAEHFVPTVAEHQNRNAARHRLRPVERLDAAAIGQEQIEDDCSNVRLLEALEAFGEALPPFDSSVARCSQGGNQPCAPGGLITAAPRQG